MPGTRIAKFRPATLVIVVVAAAGLLIGCLPVIPTFAGTGHRVANRRSADTALRESMKRLVARVDGPPGVVVAIGRGSRLTVRTAGVRDIVTRTAPKANDRMRLASVAKAFSGAAALSLVARGTLSLDDTVGKWLPGLPHAWSRVSLRELLAHTSGISDFSKSPAFIKALLASLQAPPAHRTLLSFAAADLAFRPGSRYAYSNTDNIIVGLMIEAATGRSYESLLASRVFRPLHLTRTSLPNGSAIASPYLHGYDVTPPGPPEDVSSLFAAGWTWASGGIVSTPADAIRFIRGYVTGATTSRPAQAVQFAFRPGSSEPPGPGVNAAGLALFRYHTRCGTVYGHTGNTPGYTQFLAASRNGHHAVVVSISAQITPTSSPRRFAELRHIFELAVCAAL